MNGAALVLQFACAVAPVAPVADAAPGAPPAQAPGRRPNILLVSMDTTRWDATSLARRWDTTPNLARLAALGTSFDRAFSVGNESLYAHAGLLTGRYASEVAVADYASFAVPPDVPTLATALRAYGYRTGAFTGGGHIVAEFGFDQGFDTFFSAPGAARFGSFFDSVPEALSWIGAAGDAPWFAFVHGYDAHSPYVQPGPFRHPWPTSSASTRIERIAADPLAPEQIRGRLWFPQRTPTDFVHAAGRTILATDFYRLSADPAPGEPVARLVDGEIMHLQEHYRAGVHYADVWLGVLLSHVDLSDTLVVVVSDHGEDLLDHGWVNHRAGLWDSTLRVPLVVAGPGVPAGAVRPDLVELRRVLPTVVAAAGGTPPAGAETRTLWDRGDTAVFAEGVMDEVSVRDDAGRLTLRDARLAWGAPDLAARPLDDGRAELADGRDGRSYTVGGADLTRAEPLRRRIVEWAGRRVPSRIAGAELGPEAREALRARGYWVPDPAPGGD